MATYSFKVHKDSKDGESLTLYAPIYDSLGESAEYYGSDESSFTSFINKYADYFNPLQTQFSYSDHETAKFKEFGAVNVIQLDYVDTDTFTFFYVDDSNVVIRVAKKMAPASNFWGSQVQIGISLDGGTKFEDTSNTVIPAYVPGNKENWNNLNYSALSYYSPNYYSQIYVYTGSIVSSYNQAWNEFYFSIKPLDDSDDPYKDGGYSGEGGGTGTFSGTSDSIEFPGLPTLSATSTGFITLFNPTIAEMQSLATYMWSDVFDIGLYKTLFADPMDCILGCSIVPVAVPNGGTKTVNVGNVSTGISMTVAATQYVEVDCGTLNVEEFWGSYLDYDPYTKAEIYLPYCGTHALQVDDIMGKAVHVKYHVDILSGACCAYVKCGGSVMYSFVGQCSSSIPISANDWTNVVNGALTIAASVGSLIATGGASAPMAVGAAAAVTGTIYGGGIKQNVEKSGSMGGTGGMLAVQTPYLILTRPRQALPKKQNTYTGYPSFITTKLSDLKGYTEIDSIRITGVPATDAELNELESILKSGVIF